MRLIDKVSLEGAGTVLLESARSIDFDVLLTYLASNGWNISDSQIEEVGAERTSAKKATQFLRLAKSQKGFSSFFSH